MLRVSTAQVFNAGTAGMQRNQFDLFKVQNQLSTGRRVLTPQDDPVAAAEALILSQSKDVSAQYLRNQDDARSKLGLVEGQLSTLTDLLQNVRERLVQAGNTTLSDSDRSYIAKELEARFSELMGIANAQDGAGNYLFSGFMGATKPFVETASGAAYKGDNGERLLQVETTRQLPVSLSGAALFENIRDGNGTFSTSTHGNVLSPGANNAGTGVIDSGSVTDLERWRTGLKTGSLWADPLNAGQTEVRFSTDPVTNKLMYQLYDVSGATAQPMLLDASSASLPQEYVAGQNIDLRFDDGVGGITSLGAFVTVSGTPAAGDSFRIEPSVNRSLFATLRDAITTLATSINGSNTVTEYANDFANHLENIDQALENVSRQRSTVGSSLQELDSLTNAGEDKQLQYAGALSELQDLDYTEAITQLSRKQLQLEALQLAFKQTSQLSLFNIL